jgi:hypothetical protein
MLARVKGRGTRLRRRRHMAAGGLLASLVGAITALVVTIAPGPIAHRVVIAPPLSPNVTGPAGGCPVAPFIIRATPAGSLAPTTAVTSGAYRHLGVGQTAALFAAGSQSITLTRGVGFESFAVSIWSHGSQAPMTLDVLGAPALLFPAGDGTPGARIPFRYPEAGSQSDPCQRYQLQAVGVDDYPLITTAEDLHSTLPVSPAAVPSTTTLPASAGQPDVMAQQCQASALRLRGGRQGVNG